MAHLRNNWLVEKGREGVFLDAVGELAGGQMVKYLNKGLVKYVKEFTFYLNFEKIFEGC